MQTSETGLCTQDTKSEEYKTPIFSPLQQDDIIGHTVLITPTEDGQCFHDLIMHHIEEIDELLREFILNFCTQI